LTEHYCKGADLVLEVVSDGEESHRLDRETKRDEYAKARIPEYWIVDPEQAKITVLALDARTYRVLGEYSEGDRATSRLLPGFQVDVAAAVTAKR
jgi:Uma2 family endonuclease